MKTSFTALICYVLFTCWPMASPSMYAEIIVSEHLRATNAEEKLKVLEQTLLDDLTPGIEGLGARIIDSERFMDELVGSYHEETLEKITALWVDFYDNSFSETEKIDLIRFYDSSKGKEFLQMELTENTIEDAIWFLEDGPGEPLMRSLPELILGLNHFHAQAHKDITELLSMDRIAQIVANEEIVAFEDEDRRAAVVDALLGK